MAHMTKKKLAEREKNALGRGFNGMNTGTRTHKNARYDNDRREMKVFLRKNEF
jgi:hypothetical protein